MSGYKCPFEDIEIDGSVLNGCLDIAEPEINEINLIIFVYHIRSGQIPMNNACVNNNSIAYPNRVLDIPASPIFIELD